MDGKAILKGLDSNLHFRLVWDLGNLEAAGKLETDHQKPYEALYNALAAGRIDAFDFCEDHTWHIMSRSTRPGVAVQMSVVWVREPGEMVPMSHHNINSAAEFLDLIPQGETAVHWLKLEAA